MLLKLVVAGASCQYQQHSNGMNPSRYICSGALTVRDTPFVDTSLTALTSLVEKELPRKPGAGIIVGPSHAVRWRHAITNGALPKPYDDPRIIGEGGFPVWNRSIFGQVFQRHETGMPIFLILPDFRFGNSIYENRSFALGQFYNHHSHVKKHLIRPEVDAVLYRQHVENLMTWRVVFGRDLSIFDWTQMMTASEHRWTGRYVDTDGHYANPLYAEWTAWDRLRLGAKTWPETLLIKENARMRRLIVDRALHPSAIGFFLLHHMVHGDPFVAALEKAEGLWKRWLRTLVVQLTPAFETLGTVAVSGESVWFNTALRLLGDEGVALLRNAGLFLPSPEANPRTWAPDLPPGTLHAQITDTIDISDYGVGSAPRPYRVPWAVFARTVIAARHPNNAHLAVPNIERLRTITPNMQPGQIWLAHALRSGSPETLVDAGGDQAPTFIGMGVTLLLLVEALVNRSTYTHAASQD